MSQEIMAAIQEMATKSEIEQSVAPVSAEIVELKAANDELKSRLREVEAKSASGFVPAKAQVKSLGEQFADSENFKAMAEGKSRNAQVEIKASTNATGETYSQRLAGVVGKPVESLTLLDVISTATATSNAVDYVQELLITDGAAPRADELSAYGESDYTFETKSMPVSDVGHFTKMSKNLMADNAAVASFINSKMPYQVARKVQGQIVSGTGAGGQLKGLTHVDNHTVFTPEAGKTVFENIRLAKAQMESADLAPSFVILHPEDAAELDLAKGSDGHFIAADARAVNPDVAWGVRVVKSKAVGKGKFILVDATQITLWIREGMGVETSNSDADDFQKGLVTVLATQRCALTVENKSGVFYGDLVAAV
ncbi:TPA: phage major capsid protein [Vibrio parahaemolyticus]|uniref:phage major capsid protein n=1 Tax=Vibrio TaxID=662 RepID=UPI001EEC3D13|nr:MULTISPECIES: phage major capsid protein [Vibrio]HAV1497966.1 phage major capsid protein [Vibrio parahaemolyticus]MCG6354791.1 phage major capsid protein [Vibrio alginolyticus]MCK8112502.1 phage major capsid protein [Vibrio sp. 2CM40D]HAV1503135.1 phage major capsid protein [Vibrio parahaemolyticus]HBL4682770.1 phage major capsid protein [Vibrio parahaemolyticus]